MARTTRTDFSSGEISPDLSARMDIPIFNKSVSFSRNFIPSSRGPIKFRHAGKFVGAGQANLIPYIYDGDLSYQVALRNQKANFMKDGALIMEATTPAITAISKANPCIVTSPGHGLSDGDEIYISGVNGMVQVLGGPFLVKAAAANSFTLADYENNSIDSTTFTTYVSGGIIETPFELATPWTISEAREVRYVQIGDNLFVTHRSYKPRNISNSGTITGWAIGNFAPTGDPFTSADNYPGVVATYDKRLIFASSNNGPLKLWFSQAGNSTIFTEGTGATDAFAVEIQGQVFEKIVDLYGLEDFLSIRSNFLISRASGTNGGSIRVDDIVVKPYLFLGSSDSKSTSSDNRLIFIQDGKKKIRSIRTRIEQESPSADLLNLTALHLSGSPYSKVQFMDGDPNLLIAIRDSGYASMMCIDDNEQIFGWGRFEIPDCDIYSISKAKNSNGNDDFYINVKRTIQGSTRYYTEYFTENEEIPLFEDYIDEDKDTDLDAFRWAMYEAQKRQYHLDSYLHYDGRDIGIEANAAITPSGITLGSSVTITASNAVFLSTDVGKQIHYEGISGRFLITAYTSSTQVTATVTVAPTAASQVAAGNWYLTTNQITGLRHLDGQVVGVVTDGAVHPDATVSTGLINLNYQASFVIVGKRYAGLVILNDITPDGQTTIGTKKSMLTAIVRLINTLGAQFGDDPYSMSVTDYREASARIDRPSPLFTGDKPVELQSSGMDLIKKFVIKQDLPLPCTVAAVSVKYKTQEV